MYPSYSYCSQDMRTLASDDIAAVQSLYGVSSSPSPAPSPTPTPSPTSGNTAPSVTITSPSNGATFATGTLVTLSATVIDAEDGNLSYRTTWTDNGASIGGGASLPIVFTVAGTHTIVATANDNAGVVSTATVTITIGAASAPAPAPAPAPSPTSGNTAPSLTITSPANGASFAAGSMVTLSASAIDAEDGNLSYRTTWTDNGVALGGGSLLSVPFNTAGTHVIGASVNDNAGVVSTATVTITIGSASSPTPTPTPAPAPAPGNTAPVLTILSPTNGAVVSAGTGVTLAATVFDAEDGNLSYRTTWYDNGVLIGGGSAFTWAFTAGSHTIRAQVNDNAGVIVSSTVTVTAR
jgi:hypothetical protein